MSVSKHLSKGFREEMIASAGFAGLCALASFMLLAQLAPDPSKPNKQEVLGAQTQESIETVEAPEPVSMPTPTPTPTASPSPTPSPEPTPETELEEFDNPNVVEIPYGSSQDFENNEYIISFQDPHLIVTNSRTFKVDVVVSNKSVDTGIDNTLLGVIRRDGEVISSRAPLSISEIQTIMVGEQLSFVAQISLPEGTQLTQITFEPATDIIKTTYNLDPTF